MENTNQIQFSENDPSLFLAQGESHVGPFKPSEVYEKLTRKEIEWIDFCYREKEGAWMRIADHPLFKTLQGASPKSVPKKVVPPAPPILKKVETKWFIYQKEAQTGPFLQAEVLRLIQAGQVEHEAYVWQETFSEWKLWSTVPEFSMAPLSAQAAPTKKESSERRGAPRKPLVAKIYLTNQRDIITGLCRDISVGGMQVLTDELPGKVGDRIQLNVLPPESTGLKPFVAEGEIVRVLEDRKGFSFRFSRLPDDAKAAIESYIS